MIEKKNIIIPILLGNKDDTLYGVENDVILIYNLFYKYYNLNNNWFKPCILINKNTQLININKKLIKYFEYIKSINNNDINIIIIIYFSGHSNSKGFLKFYNEYINLQTLVENINNYIIFKSNIYFIIDSCYSQNFISNITLTNTLIHNMYFMVSCNNKELSKEIEADYDINMFKFKNIKFNKKIIVGIFTYYFIKILNARNINNIYEFKNIINDNLWKIISNKYNQTISYCEIIL
jgi:hypothetical protein